MPRSRRHHDVYDDTRRGDQRHEMEHRVPVSRRRHDRDRDQSRAMIDPRHDMDRAIRRFHEDNERSLGAWGFGPMFGDPFGRGGMLSSFDRMFEDAFPSMSTMVENAREGHGTYFYESKTRTVGPDGRVHEEHVRTTPDEHGNPQTKKTFRDAESESEMDPFWRGMRSPFGQEPYGMIDDRRRDDEVIVEELGSSDEEDRNDGYRRRPSRRYRDNVQVREMEDEVARRHSRPGEWMRQRYNQWRNRA